ncbi:major membrane immunogen (membrane-anchored lipoprotein) [Bacilli bacterium PM5-9]|nr:major membrane immunogen (membrane-anchored lipoprotein) [Bacilli bacterium PM5-9]
MNKFLKYLTIIIFLICCSCQKQDNELQDGIYQAMNPIPDEHGWQTFVEYEIKDNKIINIEYDALNLQNGSKKTKAKSSIVNDFTMNSKNGEWHTQVNKLEKEIIKNQSLNPLKADSVTGATITYDDFNSLISTAKNNKIIVGKLKDGLYYSKTNKPDKNNNIYTLGYYVRNGIILGAHVDSYKSNSKEIIYNYNLSVAGKYDLRSTSASFAEQCLQISNYLVEKQTLIVGTDDNGKTDAISKATITVEPWVNLYTNSINKK